MFSRKRAASLGIVVAAVLISSSAAFACLTQKGSLIIDPTSGLTGSTVVGTGVDHGWCTWPATASTAAQSEVVNVAVAPAACGGTTYQLADRSDYEVRINTSTSSPSWAYSGGSWQFQANTGCFFASSTTIGTNFTVTSGSGNMNVTIPSGAADSDNNEAAGICVGKSGVAGIFAPLEIT